MNAKVYMKLVLSILPALYVKETCYFDRKVTENMICMMSFVVTRRRNIPANENELKILIHFNSFEQNMD